MTKIAAGVALILMLAAVGTVGVAYYNDPSLLEGTPTAASPVQQETGSKCCLMPTSECSAPAATERSCDEK